jgi:type I restriction enzyme M protein
MSNLTPVIKSIQDIMRQDSGVDGDAQRISQLTWLLFLKVFDALEEELELTRDDYQSPMAEHLRWRHWAADPEGMTGDALLDFVDKQLFPALKGLSADPQRNPRGYVVRGVFEDAYNYMKSGHLLRQVVNKLNAIDFNRQAERHQFNDLYEKILRDLQSAGNAGEFYTPRAVTQFMVDMTNPQLGESVLDPATGTGGFLVCAIEHLRKQVHNAEQEAVLQNSIRGVEKKQLPHMLCVTNLLLHGIEVPSQIATTTPWPAPCATTPSRPRGRHPHQPALWRHGRAGHRTRLSRRRAHQGNRRPLPRAHPAPAQNQRPRRRGAARRHPVWRRRQGPHQRTTAAAVQPAHHRAPAQRRVCALHRHQNQPAVLHQGPAHPAHLVLRTPVPAGRENYNKTKPIRIEEFDAEKAWWGTEADGFAARVENERAWKVSIDQIKAANYNLDQKNPHIGEQQSHDPDVLLADYARLQAEAQALRDELKGILAQSLAAKTAASA